MLFCMVLEKHFGKGALEGLTVIDVDLSNVVSSLEWGTICEAVEVDLAAVALCATLDALVPRRASSRHVAVWR